MPKLRETRRIFHDADELCALVADVERYPEFIKYIRAMRILSASEPQPGVRQFTAEAAIGFKFIRERFTTRVRVDDKARTIAVSNVSGPFRVLENHWRFIPLSDGSTRVRFDIEFEFANPLLTGVLNANLARASRFIITAFEMRAARVLEHRGDREALEPTVAETRTDGWGETAQA